MQHQETNLQNDGEPASQYGQDMPSTFETLIEPQLIPVHL